MYHTIVNPHTNRRVRTNGRIGQMVVRNYLMSEQIGGGRKKQQRAKLRNKKIKEKCDKDNDKNEIRTQTISGKKYDIDFYKSIDQAHACGEIPGNEFALAEMPLNSFIRMPGGEQIYKIIKFNSITGMMQCQPMQKGKKLNRGPVDIDASDNAVWLGKSFTLK